ncbi:RNA polymerase sigma-70 factor (ECF subfamily) [Nakamurella sp. UYEF19]|uniref:RNA polymerase sigma factor n=1 Tax=Nakamurella sp. UYEF19 TaxID=1756392 RepID=UPI00339B2EAE
MQDVAAAVDLAHREEWAKVVAATVRVTRDLDLAQECAQDAYAQALRSWPSAGIPLRPGAWLTTVARNRARDLLARESAFRRAMPLLVMDDEPGPEVDLARPTVGDERLQLIFICAHPALSGEARVALTLRLVCGLTTAEVARAFLVQETTMAARITRAKKKIALARIPYRVPNRQDLPERVGAVLEIVHLIFTTGHAAPTGEHLIRRDLVDRAVELGRLLHELLPAEPDPASLLAMMLITDARSSTRTSADGRLVLLSHQDRGRWDAALINEGVGLLTWALAAGPASRFALEAAIAAVHAESPSIEDTDWAEIVGLYDLLRDCWPNPVVDLNRAVAVGLRDGPAPGLGELEPLLSEPALATYGYLSAARADFLRRLGRWSEAAAAYREALALTDNEVERVLLQDRLDEVDRQL